VTPSIGWVAAVLVAVGLVVVGAAAVLLPRTAASQYGIALDDPRAQALIRAMGIRDVAMGMLTALLAATSAREMLAWGMVALGLVAVVDLVVVTNDRGGIDRACMPHAAGAMALLLTGALLHAGL